MSLFWVFALTVLVMLSILVMIDRFSRVRTEHSVLAQLEHGDRFGDDLVAGSNGRLRRSTAYLVLSRMEERRLIVGHYVSEDPGMLPRRRYSLTNAGRAMLRLTAIG